MLRSEIIRELLERRGISGEALESYLHPSISALAKPEELPGVIEAADVLLSAIAAGDEIVVFGDYDCDGVSATAILSTTLRAMGARVSAFIPNRLTEGYGMSEASISRMLRENPGVRMIVTVDTGINTVDQVAELKTKGLSVVVTDHHLPGEVLPAADALVDPKVAAPPHLENLCGAGVAFLLANRVTAEAKRRGMYTGGSIGGPLLVLAGLATVTDIMPLLGQNRILVSEALRRFGVCAPLGLKELFQRASRTGYDKITSRDFGFMLGPRINAAGRLSSSMEALELLESDDREIVRELARIVDTYNADRKAIEMKMTEMAMARVVEGAPAQVIDLPDGHPGVAGIVAARLMEWLKVPVCVLASGHGSARAPDGINIRDAFVSCADVLETYGGHAAAGGFSVREGKTDEFRRLLCEHCRSLAGDRSVRTADEFADVDVWLEFSDVTMDVAEDVARMEPFGEGNEEPLFGIRGAFLADVRQVGADGRHLSVSFRDTGLRGVWWGHGQDIERLRAGSASPHDIAFNLALSDYGGRHIDLHLVACS